MATPKIVPRATGEGSLGDAAYGWGGAFVTNTTTSSASQGGKLVLAADDGAVMASGHRLGVIEFKGAEDTGHTLTIGARIEALTDDTWSASENGASLKFYTTDANASESLVLTLDSDKLATFAGNVTVDSTKIEVSNTTTSSATEGGKLNLISDDGAALGDDHQLGKIGFLAAEDGSSTLRTGASIRAYADAAWSDTENGTRLEFYTMDGNNTSELSLTLDSDLLATFAGDVTVTGALTGTLATASQPNITTVGTIGAGTWEGTAIATDQQKHLACFKFAGYGTCDGTNYEIPEIMTDTNAPFEHNTSAGSDGLTALAVSVLIRAAGHAVPYAGTLKKWLGWAASSGSGATYIALFRYRPDPSSSSSVSLALLGEQSFTAAGNNTVVAINQTSFTDADIAVGDIIYTGIKCQSAKVTYFNSTLEIEWD